jgi:acetamidase/formamidase
MHNRWHPDIPPVAGVATGEHVTLECEDGIAGLLTRDSVHADCGTLDLGLAHPLAGPVAITGAEPGDVLEVDFHEYRSADFGVTAVVPGFGFLADRPIGCAAGRRGSGGDVRGRRRRGTVTRAPGGSAAA